MLPNCRLKTARLPIRRTAGPEPGSDGACRLAQGRRYSCDIPKPRIRIEPCFLNDIAESNDTAALIVFLKCNRRRFWLKSSDWSGSHDPRALQGAD